MSETEILDALSRAESRMNAARAELREAGAELRAAQEADMLATYGVGHESIVRRLPDGKEFKVAKLSYDRSHPPMLSGWPRIKSGCFGAKAQYVGMNWEVVK